MDPRPSLILDFKRRIKSMTHKIDLSNSNTSIPHNMLQATIRSSKSVRGEHEIKKTLQVSKLVG